MAGAPHLLDDGAAVVHQVRRHGNHQAHVLRVRSHHFSKEARYKLAAIGVEVRLPPQETHTSSIYRYKSIVGKVAVVSGIRSAREKETPAGYVLV